MAQAWLVDCIPVYSRNIDLVACFCGVAGCQMAGLGVATGLTATTTAPDRVWSLKELDILQDLTKPVAVVVTGAYEDPHW